MSSTPTLRGVASLALGLFIVSPLTACGLSCADQANRFATFRSSKQIELSLNHLSYFPHVLYRKDTNSFEQTLFAHRGQLIRHRLALFPPHPHIHLPPIKTIRFAGERDTLNAIEEFIGGVVADDDGRTFFSDLPPNRGFETNP